LKADLKRGRNQYLKLDVDTRSCCLDEERIAEAQKYDGYYAVITNNLDYSTEEVSTIYGGLWQIEETFRVLKTDLQARPVFVWSDQHNRQLKEKLVMATRPQKAGLYYYSLFPLSPFILGLTFVTVFVQSPQPQLL